MKRFDLYGCRSLPLSEAAQRLAALLKVPLELHDSSYRGGEYYRGSGGPVEELIVQSNFADEDGYLAEPDFHEYQTLVYVTGPSEPTTNKLNDFNDLTLLRTEFL